MKNFNLPNIDAIHAKDPRSKKKAISTDFLSTFKSHFFKNIFLTVITLGLFAQKLKKNSKSKVLQAIAARKISYIILLMEFIKNARTGIQFTDPRQAITTIFMKINDQVIESEDKNIEVRAIYAPAEILLFITNPIRDIKQLKLHRFSRRQTDYIRLWQEIKKKSKVNQFRQIQSINFYTKSIKEQFLLSQIGIHDRLMRSAMYRKAPGNLTMFKELSSAFLEIIVAYEEFEDLKNSDKELHQLISLLSVTPKNDIKKLCHYMETGSVHDSLSPENRRQLIQLGNKQRALYSITSSEILDMSALILDKHQWEFLLSLQKASDVSLNLIHWAYDQTPNVMDKISFSEKLLSGSLKLLPENQDFSSFVELQKNEAPIKQMLEMFAAEEGRRWPQIEMYCEGKISFQVGENLSIDKNHIIAVYSALYALSPSDETLLFLLQKSLTREGQECFEQAIEQGVLKLLGEKSEFFIPVLSNTKIVISKQSPTLFSFNFFFNQNIHRQGEQGHVSSKEKFLQIKQDIDKQGSAWISKTPQVCLKGENVF
ncbi:hypothetical protein COB21_04600 [Candidatus Aerophobetes bacterium]|uniref:Uncharacterized protein n=1 Tax=Aerophobetes bacterium TaxID=2030807 RepID=A0A2A4X2J5_UNCAE|nr:MAG: hypothetical protein COB21_04600 [Candidatus Aerophobetes bacterium]